MTIPFWAQAVAMFACGTVIDWCWAYYNRRSTQGAAAQAAWWSVAIGALGAFAITEYMANRWLLPPMWAGYWVGTYYAVRRDHAMPQPAVVS